MLRIYSLKCKVTSLTFISFVQPSFRIIVLDAGDEHASYNASGNVNRALSPNPIFTRQTTYSIEL